MTDLLVRRGSGTAKTKRLPRVRFAYLVVVVLMALFAWKFIERTQQVRRLSAQQSALMQANAQIGAENTNMRRSIRYYGTPSYIEGQARSLFGYVRPGEVAVEVQAPRISHPVIQPAPATLHPAALPVWRQWVDSFVQ